MEYEVLDEVLWLLAGSVLVVAVLRRLNLPSIVGYLLVGMILGPRGFGLINSFEDARELAELGVVFLLFTLGLEFSLARMLVIRAEVFLLGSAQVVLTTLAAATIAWSLGLDPGAATLLGGAIAMSSTAIVVKQLTEQLEVGTVHGRLAVGVLLFQDLAIVLFLALIPALAGPVPGYTVSGIAFALLKGLAAIVIVLLAGRHLLRPLFQEIGRTRAAELFTMAVLLVVLGAAWSTHLAGLSLALGAFLAGMMLAETEYRHQIEIDIRPFRDVLLGLFFITVGMLVDVRQLWDDIGFIGLLVALLIAGKALVTTLLSRWFAGDWYDAYRSALVTAQGGEFGLALITLALHERVLPESAGSTVLAAIVVSMAISPFVIRYNARLAALLFARPGQASGAELGDDLVVQDVAAREHVIICGFGRVGQNIARILDQDGFEYIALDLDPRRVRIARQAGDTVYFGDAERADILLAVGLKTASVVIVSFANPQVALKIVRAIRELRRDVPVLVRTPDDSYLNELESAGASAIVPETLEASLMLASHVLAVLRMPPGKILRRMQNIRHQRYGLLRSIFRGETARAIDATHALREELQTLSLPPGAYAAGRTLADLGLDRSEVSVTAIRRDGIVGRQPAPETVLRDGDVLVLYGTPEALEHAETVLLSG